MAEELSKRRESDNIQNDLPFPSRRLMIDFGVDQEETERAIEDAAGILMTNGALGIDILFETRRRPVDRVS